MVSQLFRKKKPSSQVLDDMATKQKRYEVLVHALHKDLYRYAYWLVKDPSVAEDLVQETFLRAWRSLDSLKDEKAAKAWLITILRRENARRFERKQFNLVDMDDQPIADEVSLSSEDDTEHHWLRRQIETLPDEYREPLVMQVLLGFSGDEIAEALELNKNTVMTRLFRARNMLRDKITNDSTERGQANG